MAKGLRGKAMATPVPNFSRWVCSATIISGRKGSWPTSGVMMESYPISPIRLAYSPMAWIVGATRGISRRMRGLLSSRSDELSDGLVDQLRLVGAVVAPHVGDDDGRAAVQGLDV